MQLRGTLLEETSSESATEKTWLDSYNEVFNKMVTALPSARSVYGLFFTFLIITSYIATACAQVNSPITTETNDENDEAIDQAGNHYRDDENNHYSPNLSTGSVSIDPPLNSESIKALHERFAANGINNSLAERLIALIKKGNLSQVNSILRSHISASDKAIGFKAVLAELLFSSMFEEDYQGECEDYLYEVKQAYARLPHKQDDLTAATYWSVLQIQTYLNHLPSSVYTPSEISYTLRQSRDFTAHVNIALATLQKAKQYARSESTKSLAETVLYDLAQRLTLYLPLNKSIEFIKNIDLKKDPHSYMLIYRHNHPDIARTSLKKPIPEYLLNALREAAQQHPENTAIHVYLTQLAQMQPDDTHCMLRASSYFFQTEPKRKLTTSSIPGLMLSNSLLAKEWLTEAADRGNIQAAVELINSNTHYNDNEIEKILTYGIQINYADAYQAQALRMSNTLRFERFFETFENFLKNEILLNCQSSQMRSYYLSLMLDLNPLLDSFNLNSLDYLRSRVIKGFLYYHRAFLYSHKEDMLTVAKLLLDLHQNAAFNALPPASLIKKDAHNLFKHAESFIQRNLDAHPINHQADALLQWGAGRHDKFLERLELFLDEKSNMSKEEYLDNVNAMVKYHPYFQDKRLNSANSMHAIVIYVRLLIAQGNNQLAFQTLYHLCEQKTFQNLPIAHVLRKQVRKILQSEVAQDINVLQQAKDCRRLLIGANAKSSNTSPQNKASSKPASQSEETETDSLIISNFFVKTSTQIVITIGSLLTIFLLLNEIYARRKKSTKIIAPIDTTHIPPNPVKRRRFRVNTQQSTDHNAILASDSTPEKSAATPNLIEQKNEPDETNKLLTKYKEWHNGLLRVFYKSHNTILADWKFHRKLANDIKNDPKFTQLTRVAQKNHDTYQATIKSTIAQLNTVKCNFTYNKDELNKLSFNPIKTKSDACSQSVKNHLDNIKQLLHKLNEQYTLLKNIGIGDNHLAYTYFITNASYTSGMNLTITTIRTHLTNPQSSSNSCKPIPTNTEQLLETDFAILENIWGETTDDAPPSSTETHQETIITPETVAENTSTASEKSITKFLNDSNYTIYRKNTQELTLFPTNQNDKGKEPALSKKENILRDGTRHIQEILAHYRLHPDQRDANENRQLADQTDIYALYYYVLRIISYLYESEKNALTKAKAHPTLLIIRFYFAHCDSKMINEMEKATFIAFCDLLVKENILLNTLHIERSSIYKNLENGISVTLNNRMEKLKDNFAYLRNMQHADTTLKNTVAIKSAFTFIGEVYNSVRIFDANTNEPEMMHELDDKETTFAYYLRKIGNMRNKVSHNQNPFIDSHELREKQLKELFKQANHYSETFINNFTDKIMAGIHRLHSAIGNKAERGRYVATATITPSETTTPAMRF